MRARQTLAELHADKQHDGVSAADTELLQQAIVKLTEDQQMVLFLRFFEGLKHEEIGTVMGRSSNAVRAAQFRAISRLRCLLGAQKK